MLTVAVLYTSVQMIFAAIIPKADLFKAALPGGMDVGGNFFARTLGKVMKSTHVTTFYCLLKAFSAFGNIVVVTFTAARGNNDLTAT